MENKKLIVSPENPNGVLIDMTAEEIAQKEIDMATSITEQQARDAKEQANATNKANGNQKLLDLGLTQAEATALTGYKPEE
jgi:hypothetical protein